MYGVKTYIYPLNYPNVGKWSTILTLSIWDYQISSTPCMETTIQDPGLSWWCLFVQFLFLTPLKINMEHDHGQWRFGRSFSFLNGWFVGSMLIFQGVRWTFVFQYGSLLFGAHVSYFPTFGSSKWFLDILAGFLSQHITVVPTKPVILAKLNPRLQFFFI